MAKTCIQCGKKIGLFSKPVDGIYCSLECQAAAHEQEQEAERFAVSQRAEAVRKAAEEAKAAEAQRAEERKLRTCPRCGGGWTFTPGVGPGSTHAGNCPICGFSATFATIEECPSCSGPTFLAAPTGAGHCPRCKYRR